MKFSVLGPLTRVEKSLLQAHFHSVNYCQYNIIDPRTLIYVPSSHIIVTNVHYVNEYCCLNMHVIYNGADNTLKSLKMKR
ncbi:hypothetical protein D3233_11725 [Staphylococcus aureus]|uniref:Uncharacterized protein n=1 Tax=Staphylococcus aureus subsp. aureus DR10 TaxID=1155079 RepID=A0ABC9PYS3_STAA5|nr:hypothetical protein ST398NM01_2987 [Staphylococcus aureus subsp. aureus 71193]ARH70294.1 hypothetical protein BZJ79_12095 [Staphylococcus aureus]EIA13460.1 hypothetical protein ST398NM02_2987 [Staphylococcus aureus subsp. aureus DR10]ARH73015.1 hypothetical protein BZK07_12470 [Staphylococcus aureus]ARH75795.1 hypothetical protein BZK08_12590 [Staphylococcus aureus]